MTQKPAFFYDDFAPRPISERGSSKSIRSKEIEEDSFDIEEETKKIDKKTPDKAKAGGGFRDYSVGPEIISEMNIVLHKSANNDSRKYLHSKTLVQSNHRRRNSSQQLVPGSSKFISAASREASREQSRKKFGPSMTEAFGDVEGNMDIQKRNFVLNEKPGIYATGNQFSATTPNLPSLPLKTVKSEILITQCSPNPTPLFHHLLEDESPTVPATKKDPNDMIENLPRFRQSPRPTNMSSLKPGIVPLPSFPYNVKSNHKANPSNIDPSHVQDSHPSKKPIHHSENFEEVLPKPLTDYKRHPLLISLRPARTSPLRNAQNGFFTTYFSPRTSTSHEKQKPSVNPPEGGRTIHRITGLDDIIKSSQSKQPRKLNSLKVDQDNHEQDDVATNKSLRHAKSSANNIALLHDQSSHPTQYQSHHLLQPGLPPLGPKKTSLRPQSPVQIEYGSPAQFSRHNNSTQSQKGGMINSLSQKTMKKKQSIQENSSNGYVQQIGPGFHVGSKTLAENIARLCSNLKSPPTHHKPSAETQSKHSASQTYLHHGTIFSPPRITQPTHPRKLLQSADTSQSIGKHRVIFRQINTMSDYTPEDPPSMISLDTGQDSQSFQTVQEIVSHEPNMSQLRALDLLTDTPANVLVKLIRSILQKQGLDPFVDGMSIESKSSLLSLQIKVVDLGELRTIVVEAKPGLEGGLLLSVILYNLSLLFE